VRKMAAGCKMIMQYADEDTAKSIEQATSIENLGFLKIKVRGRELLVTMESNDPKSLSHTIEDFLACVNAAEAALSINIRIF